MQTSDERNLRDIEQHVVQHRRRQRPTQKIGDVLSSLLARRGYAQIQSGLELQQAWVEAVGDHLARHSRAARLRRGVLQIVVQNSIAMQELSFQKAELLKRVKQILVGEKIRDLRFQVGPIEPD